MRWKSIKGAEKGDISTTSSSGTASTIGDTASSLDTSTNTAETKTPIKAAGPEHVEIMRDMFPELLTLNFPTEIQLMQLPGPFKDTRFVPEAAVEETLTSDLSIYRMASKKGIFEKKMNCVFIKGLRPYEKVIKPDVQSVIQEILENDMSVFNDVSDPLDLKELADAVMSRNEPGGIPAADNLYRSLIGLSQIPDVTPSEFFSSAEQPIKYTDFIRRKII